MSSVGGGNEGLGEQDLRDGALRLGAGVLNDKCMSSATIALVVKQMGARFARSGSVLPPRANVAAAARRGACGARAASCGTVAPHRPFRRPASGQGEAKPGVLPELAGEGLRRIRGVSGAQSGGARRGERGVRESGQRAVQRDGAGGRATGRGARAERTRRASGRAHRSSTPCGRTSFTIGCTG